MFDKNGPYESGFESPQYFVGFFLLLQQVNLD